MDKIAGLSKAERNELFRETAAQLGTTPAVVEKDFWVSWVLKKLFEDATWGPCSTGVYRRNCKLMIKST